MRESFSDYGIVVGTAFGQIKVRCPECTPGRKKENQSRKDLSVNTDAGVWSCKHCGWEGFLKDGNRRSKITVKPEKKNYDKPKYKSDPLTDAVVSYFGERGISRATLDRCGIGFDKATRSIMFPYKKSGQVVNIKFRTQDKKFRQCKNAEKTVFMYDNIDDEFTVITEGEMDAVSIVESGIDEVCSLPDGASAFTFWESVEDRFKSVKKVIIWTDNDQPGYQARQELAKRVGYEKAYYVETPKDCSDANEVLKKYGADKVRQLIAEAREFPIDGIVYAKDVDLVGYWKHGAKEGLSTGLKSLDPFWKFAPEAGELVVATGYPGHGKSDFMLDLLVRQAKNGHKIGLFSPEEFPLPRLMKKCVEKFYGLNAKELCEDQVEAAHHWLHENFFFQYLEDDTPDVDMICDSIKALAIKKGVRFYLCDPWNELDHSVRGNLSETEWVNMALGKLRRVARAHCVTVIVVAHPVKPRPEDEGKAPSSWAIAGSAGFRNKSDVVLSVNRPYYGKQEENGEVDINITKVKDKDLGGLGIVRLNYQYECGNYNDIF